MGSNGVSFLPCLPGELVAAVEMAGSSGGLLLPVRREQHEAVVRSAVIVLSGKALPAVNGGRHWTVDGGAMLVRAKCFWQRWINVSCLFCKKRSGHLMENRTWDMFLGLTLPWAYSLNLLRF
ncbi:uncharacterized protein LOC116028097 [Ipomoea triloba]|uniref:uncharacterized protein LOC116028097 n=1 Tax=Ipomoea triloba TaxID=35885 RepID=UPI00125D5385|nr:uncharacterized protein LOC116028097 [Ipomoea triloba]